MSYFNTTRSKGKDLKKAKDKSLSQEELIKRFMKLNKHKAYTPFEIQDEFVKDYGLSVWPITSVRRAMSNLTSSNILIKTDTQVKGDYGKLNYKWQYNKEIK